MNRMIVADRNSRLRTLILLGAIIVNGCNGPSDKSSENYLHDAGRVFLSPSKQGSWKVEHAYTFTNPARGKNAHLRVKWMSCGCAECIIQKADPKPGETSEITLRLTLPYQRRRRVESVEISTGLESYPTFMLSLRADAYPEFVLSPDLPERLVLLPDEVRRFDVRVYAYGPNPFDASDIVVSTEGPRVSCKMNRIVAPAESKNGVCRVVLECGVEFASRERSEAIEADEEPCKLVVRRGDTVLEKVVVVSQQPLINAVCALYAQRMR